MHLCARLSPCVCALGSVGLGHAPVRAWAAPARAPRLHFYASAWTMPAHVFGPGPDLGLLWTWSGSSAGFMN